MQQRCLEEAVAFLKEEHGTVVLDDETINEIIEDEYPKWKTAFIQESSEYFCQMIFSSALTKSESIEKVKEFLCIESYEVKEGH